MGGLFHRSSFRISSYLSRICFSRATSRPPWRALSTLSYISPERDPRFCIMCWAGQLSGECIVIGRNYFTRQATPLLKFAKSTANPELAAMLIEKAAELKSQVEASPPPDRSPRAPDVEPPG